MYEELSFFKAATALARHAGERQVLLARNVANSETPGYAPRDMPAFATLYDGDRRDNGATAMRSTRLGHITEPFAPQAGHALSVARAADTSPDGNAVSLETEMVRAADIRQQHEMAVSVYRSGMDLLRAGLGRIR